MSNPNLHTRPQYRRRSAALLGVALLVLGALPAGAAVTSYIATLSGGAEAPPNASAGTGFAQVDIDPVARTLRVITSFEGLGAGVTVAHIHGPTAVAGTGTAGAATPTPTFPGFPSGVTAGVYDATFDTTQPASFGAAFLANNGGTPAMAEAALFAAIAEGKAYLNIHTSAFPGGEIRGFLQPTSVAAESSSWGGVKTLFR